MLRSIEIDHPPDGGKRGKRDGHAADARGIPGEMRCVSDNLEESELRESDLKDEVTRKWEAGFMRRYERTDNRIAEGHHPG
jgi:hypothetical protein